MQNRQVFIRRQRQRFHVADHVAQTFGVGALLLFEALRSVTSFPAVPCALSLSAPDPDSACGFFLRPFLVMNIGTGAKPFHNRAWNHARNGAAGTSDTSRPPHGEARYSAHILCQFQ